MDYNKIARVVDRAYKSFKDATNRECAYRISICNDFGKIEVLAHLDLGIQGTIDLVVADDETGIVETNIITDYWVLKYREGFIQW